MERTWAAVERVRDAQIIRAFLAEKESLLRYIHHRVKNNLQLIASLINLQASELEDTGFAALLDAIRNRVYSIAAVHEIIAGSQEYAGVHMAACARQLVPELLGRHDSGQWFKRQSRAVASRWSLTVP